MVDDSSSAFVIDDAYEFSAPRFFDFINGESEEEIRVTELWFDTALTYAPSPFMPGIKTGRSVQLDSLCDFSEAEQLQKLQAPTSIESNARNIMKEITLAPDKDQIRPQSEVIMPVEMTEEVPIEAKENATASLVNLVPADENICEAKHVASTIENGSISTGDASSPVKFEPRDEYNPTTAQETCFPKLRLVSEKGNLSHTNTKKEQTAKKIASVFRNPLAMKFQNRSQLSQAKSTIPISLRRETKVKDSGAALNFARENQAIKRQKLEVGSSRQIVNMKPQVLPHKLRPDVISSSSNLCLSVAKTHKEDRKVYVREPVATFVSTAEMMKKFQSNTREMSLPHDTSAIVAQKKTKLTLTRPKEPEFETAQRVRPVRVKSSAELEEEMMAKIPKFKARPLNKKILEAASLPALPRTVPNQPEFQEFHLETMERAMHNAETSTIASTESAPQTSLRARPPRIKTSAELEMEALENAPKFKARPLNKKIFGSKGDLGMFCNTKRHVTVPQEFHFATDERIRPSANVPDIFDKLSLCLESHQDKRLPRNTTPNPLHLHSEIPPKPKPKHSTKPEPSQLESLARHDEEMQSGMENEEAQSILIEDPIPVPEKVRKPLIDVQVTNLHIEHRAVDRAEFDKKGNVMQIKGKDMIYKRYREEAESANMMEEEKALKQLRRTSLSDFAHPFLPQKSSREVTKPKSPPLHVNRRKKRQEFLSTTFNMR